MNKSTITMLSKLNDISIAFKMLNAEVSSSFSNGVWTVYAENPATIGIGNHKILSTAMILAIKDMGHEA